MIHETTLTQAARQVAQRYGRPRAVLVASGGAALQIALTLTGVGRGDDVLVPSIGCYKIAGAVVRVGARPVFVDVSTALVLTPSAVEIAMTPRVRAVVAVHEYGLPCPVRQLRDVLPPDVPLIEDVAQAWGARSEGLPVGTTGDLVVTSFGPTKPVGLGAGGAILGDELDATSLVDHGDADQRHLADVPFFAPFPAPLAPFMDDAFNRASARVAANEAFAAAVVPVLDALGFGTWSGQCGDRPVWTRVPVWLPPGADLTALGEALARVGIDAQLPHAVSLVDLPMFAVRTIEPDAPGADRQGPDLLLLRPETVPSTTTLAEALGADGLAMPHA